MLENEAAELSEMARSFMPKSSDAQVALLKTSILPFGVDDCENSIAEHARESEFISVPVILRKIRAKSGNACAEERQRTEKAAAIERVRKLEREKLDTDSSVNEALKFCLKHSDRLDEWRAEISAEQPYLAGLTAGKETLKSTALVCAIYTKFGKIPLECGL